MEEIGVHIEENFKGLIDEEWARKLTHTILKAEDTALPYEVSVVLTDSETVQKLNRDYRGVDEPTDVLSFCMLLQQENEPSFIPSPDGITHLGEVIISYPQAARQANEQKHSIKQELALLLIHGILHLLGYDHEHPDEKIRMRAREKELLEKVY